MAIEGTIAEKLAKDLREISVTEFFEKNKHLLGFNNPTKALIMAVKEAVDNSLDACEEAGILPNIYVEVAELKKAERGGVYRVIVRDNGPGIPPDYVPQVFGKFLYGSKFHKIKQSRGQQGIGISAVVLYAQATTGSPTIVITRTSPNEPAYRFEIMIDVKRNEPIILSKKELKSWPLDHGTEVRFTLIGDYVENRKQSILSYLEQISVVAPYASIVFKNPRGDIFRFERKTQKMPPPPKEIKPHPHGIDIGYLIRMLANTRTKSLKGFLISEFTRVGEKTAEEILRIARLDPNINPKSLEKEQIEKLYNAMQRVKILAPPTDCLSPIGEELFKIGIKRLYGEKAEFIETVSRRPTVYGGNPFLVEVGIAYGGSLPKNSQAEIYRYANKIPLLYGQSGCLITKVISSIDWRTYGLNQPGGVGIPQDAVIFFAHIASTNVPYVSESKDAIAEIPEIENELRLAFQELGRLLRLHIQRKRKLAKIAEKKKIISEILPAIAEKVSRIVNKPVPDLDPVIARVMNNYLFEDHVKYHKRKKTYEVIVSVTNYTRIRRRFDMYLRVPKEAEIVHVEPEPVEIVNNYIHWNVPRMETNESRTFYVSFKGVEEGVYEEAEIFVEGIEPEYLVGAEAFSEEEYTDMYGAEVSEEEEEEVIEK
ncbi:MAG: DNA topoisomerase VI subunit B [Euryarchaeota archaeon]|nr:DNA topoisomerase VI subunit B [Euryarchaeota archaeon]